MIGDQRADFLIGKRTTRGVNRDRGGEQRIVPRGPVCQDWMVFVGAGRRGAGNVLNFIMD